MVIADNWAIVSGDVTEVRPSATYTSIVMYVERVEDYGNFPNYFSDAEGQFVTVDLPKGTTCPKVGARVEWKLKYLESGPPEVHPSDLAS